MFERMQIYEFFATRCGQIEVVWDGQIEGDDTLVREFFPIPYSCYGFERDETARKQVRSSAVVCFVGKDVK